MPFLIQDAFRNHVNNRQMKHAFSIFEAPPFRRQLLLNIKALATILAIAVTVTAYAQTIVVPASAPANVKLAAKEIRRYVYLRTGNLLPVRETGSGIALKIDPSLEPQQYRLKTAADTLTISGGSDVGVLYGAYAFVGKLGVRFYLHGDVVPDGKIPFAIPQLDETQKPLFETRGIQPFHDFPEGPDWWSTDDYLAYVSQLAKLRMNFIGLHCYPEGGFGPEPLVWIGSMNDVDEKGKVKFSSPSSWANTLRDFWGYTPAITSDFAGGAAQLFPTDDYGNEVQVGLMPRPKTTEECNEVFDRTAALLRVVFVHAKNLGVKTCIGTETPLTIPNAVGTHFNSQGETNPAAMVRDLYKGMFARIQRACPVDYYWLWTPEIWSLSGNDPKQFEATAQDIQAAIDANQSLGHPFTLATSGWVLGPMHDRAALDAFLPKDMPMSCINREVGHAAVEPAFANILGRPKWAIPWLENDGQLTQPQPWVARMRYDAADAKRLGCTGLLGIHWRTKAMMQNVAALADAAWDQSWIPASYDAKPAKPQSAGNGALDGTATASSAPVAGTDETPVYQTVRYNVNGYNLTVPNGTYTVTLKFVEPHYDKPGMRVFGARIQGKQVIETLDVFAKAGKNQALDCNFNDIEVTNGVLRIDFTRQVEFPCIAGIVIDGTTKAVNQIASQPFTRKINCGGQKFKDYEADLVMGGGATASKDRAMPIADYYTDFARANFGENVAAAAGAIMAGVDGMKMPHVTDWFDGPGGIYVNPTPWATVKPNFEFVESFEKLRSQIHSAGDLERFDYWLNTYRAAEATSHFGCVRAELDRAANALKTEPDAALKKQRAQDALTVRIRLARAWEKLLSFQTAACDTPGELGTIANLEQHNRRQMHLLDGHDEDIAAALGTPLPAEAMPSARFDGAPRIIVPTVRTSVAAGEKLQLKIMVLDGDLAQFVALQCRQLGTGAWQTIEAKHVARAIWSVTFPAATADFEYQVIATTATGAKLVWPATAPERNQTVIVQ
jgi:hypothetical protein